MLTHVLRNIHESKAKQEPLLQHQERSLQNLHSYRAHWKLQICEDSSSVNADWFFQTFGGFVKKVRSVQSSLLYLVDLSNIKIVAAFKVFSYIW
jgi:hypothetical protein